MLLWHVICLLLGVLPWAEAATANLGIWSFSPSCSKYKGASGKGKKVDLRKVLQTALNDVLNVAEASVSSFEFVLQKRPDERTDPDGHTKWNQISEAMAATVGFSANPYQVQQATGEQWSQVTGLFQKIKNTLPATRNNPAKGYNTGMYQLSEPRPMIVCGEADWDWVGLNNWVPGTFTDFKKFSQFQNVIKKGAVGGWYLLNRWAMKNTPKGKPIFCSKDQWAQVYFKDNMIVLCDVLLEPERYKVSLKEVQDSSTLIKQGDSLRPYIKSFSFSLLHELTHWFGGPVTKSDGSMDLSLYVVSDRPAVDENGKILYLHGDALVASKGLVTADEIKKYGLTRIDTYGVESVWNLAVTHKESWATYSGPDVAIYSAESLAILGLMLYLDKWNWADKGLARKPGKLTS